MLSDMLMRVCSTPFMACKPRARMARKWARRANLASSAMQMGVTLSLSECVFLHY